MFQKYIDLRNKLSKLDKYINLYKKTSKLEKPFSMYSGSRFWIPVVIGVDGGGVFDGGSFGSGGDGGFRRCRWWRQQLIEGW